MSIHRIDFLGIPVHTGVQIADVCRLLQKRDMLRLVTFVNPQAWAHARRFPRYVPALREMSFVLPDGQGVATACRLLTGHDCPRISFDMTSLADPFFRAAAADNAAVMLVGGGPGVDEGVQERLHNAYPNLRIAASMHGFNDFEPKIARIMAARPDVVVVGMGSPRQEDFLLALRDAGYGGLAITCGGFFDQYLEGDKYYPDWVDTWNLRFAWRLYKERRR
ncbi:MAG: WecB/TagA/CpsF family glycosyltransferase [Bdellovibrionales bacterium]